MPDRRDAAWYETAFGAHYPLLYRHRNEDEAARAVAVLADLAPLAEPICDLGCGDGRHLAVLAARGAKAVGIDLSPHLLAVAAARPELVGVPLVRANMRRIPLCTATCGTVSSLFTAFGYFPDSDDNAGTVREVARVLRPGGHWILDYFDADALRAELGDGRPRSRERILGPLVVQETRRFAVATERIVKDVELTPAADRVDEAAAHGVGPSGIRYREEVAVYTLEELDGMAADAGLRRIAAAGDYDGRGLGRGTRWILVYAKPEAGQP